MPDLKSKNNEEIQKALDEILEENVSVETFQETAARSLEDAEFDKVNSMLLEYYNEKIGYDFEASLKQQLKLMVNEKVLSKLNDSKDLEKSKDEKIREIGNEENVDKDTLEKASSNIDKEDNQNEKNGSNEEYDLRAELMKQVYIEAFKKYSNIIYRLKEKQAYNRDLTIGDKQGTELVLYERYLMNLENNYRIYAGMKNLDEKALNDNEEIKELKEKLEYDLGKKEDYIDNKVNKRLSNFKEVYQKRQEIVKKLNEISDDKDLQKDTEEFKKQMDYYQEEYRKITYEMRVLDPTLQEYEEMIRIENENKEFARRKLGINSEVGFNSGYSDKQKEEDTKKVTSSTESRAINMEFKDDESIKNTVDNLMHEAYTLVNQDIDLEKAEEYIQSAEDMLGIYENEKSEAEGAQEKVSNEELDKYMDKNISGKSNDEIRDEEKNAKDPSNYEDPYSVRSECNDTKVEDNSLNKKLELKERLKRVQEKYNILYKSQKEEFEKNEPYIKSL